MLVLTRKASEQIQIGDQVVITILQVKGQSVRIGIEAPREVLVLRRIAQARTRAHTNRARPRQSPSRGVLERSRGIFIPASDHAAPHHHNPAHLPPHPGRTPGRGRSGSDPRRHPDRAGAGGGAGAATLRPTFLNYL